MMKISAPELEITVLVLGAVIIAIFGVVFA